MDRARMTLVPGWTSRLATVRTKYDGATASTERIRSRREPACILDLALPRIARFLGGLGAREQPGRSRAPAPPPRTGAADADRARLGIRPRVARPASRAVGAHRRRSVPPANLHPGGHTGPGGHRASEAPRCPCDHLGDDRPTLRGYDGGRQFAAVQYRKVLSEEIQQSRHDAHSTRGRGAESGTRAPPRDSWQTGGWTTPGTFPSRPILRLRKKTCLPSQSDP